MPYQYKREPLSDEEANQLQAVCESFEEKLVVWTLLDTGLRIQELSHLTKANILWQEQRLMIYGKGGPYGKQSKRRVIPLTPRVFQLLSHVFAHANEMPFAKRTAQRLVKKVANRAAIAKPVTPHVLRHTFAVTCLKKGINPRTLQGLLGHDRITTTEIYMNLSPEDMIREFQEKWFTSKV